MSELRFDDRVVVVTGAGNGLGRAHALLFASRGAKVVVNDLGGDIHGGGGSAKAADVVVKEIQDAGGEAVANYDSVTDGTKIVQTAMDTWGRIDVVVNNAGILRDVSFHKMTEADWDLVYQVHVKGSFAVTHAAWPHMREAGYGRVVMTASAAGIYGNFGQANYAMAKLGLHGFGQTLAIEGRKRGIHVNTIAPIAGSRMTETVLPQNLLDALKPEYVSPLVAWLAHEDCEASGGLYGVGGGHFAGLRWERSRGKTFRVGRAVSPEDVRSSWDAIAGMEPDHTEHPENIAQSMQPVMANLERGGSKGGNEWIDVDEALGYEFPAHTSSYTERDLALYALGVGAAKDGAGELDLVYEMSRAGFKAIPSYAVIPAVNLVLDLGKRGIQAPGLHYGLDRVLHGEQKMTLERPLPKSATLRHEARIKDIFDKGKGALVVTEIRSYDEDGDLLITNELTTFVRGAGGWGGDRGPSADKNPVPDRTPDAVIEEKTDPNQALLYRLSGDWNPLHADPDFAKAMKFDRPILHGLCTFGFATRQVLGALAPDGDPRYFKSIDCRFAKSVFPGETLVTEAWKDGQRIVFRTKVKERDEVVLSNAAIELYETIPAKKPKPKAAKGTATSVPAEAPSAPSGPISADIFHAIGLWMTEHEADTKKVDKVFRFDLSEPASVWTVDCKSARVAEGETAKPDCTLELTDANFLAMCTGKADPQKLYFGGDLKIGGDIMASQKLSFLQKVEEKHVKQAMDARGDGSAVPPTELAAPTTDAAPARAAFAPTLFDALTVKGGGAGKVQVRVTDPDGAWLVDLGEGSVKAGTYDGADTTLTLDDATLAALAKGDADAADLFQHGKLRVDGDLAGARSLDWLRA